MQVQNYEKHNKQKAATANARLRKQHIGFVKHPKIKPLICHLGGIILYMVDCVWSLGIPARASSQLPGNKCTQAVRSVVHALYAKTLHADAL
jgi:hypothetical protein